MGSYTSSTLELDTNKFITILNDAKRKDPIRGGSLQRFYITDSLLDTVFQYQNYHYANTTALLKNFSNTSLYVYGIRSYLNTSLSTGYIQKLYKQNMTPEWEINYDTSVQSMFMYDACIDSSDNILTVGYLSDTGNRMGMFMACYSPTGQELWNKRFSWWNGYQVANSIRQMRNGNFMIGGSVGSQVGGMEIDQYGNVVTPFMVLYTPLTRGTTFAPQIIPLSNGNYLFSGTQPNMRAFIGICDRYGRLAWSVDDFCYFSYPAVYADGETFVVSVSDSAQTRYWYRKYAFDGRLIWQISNPTPRNSHQEILDIIPTTSGNGLSYGSLLQYNQPSAQLQWIANVGRPAPPLVLSQSLQVKSTFCFPSPAREQTTISLPLDLGLDQLVVTFTNQLGQQFALNAIRSNGGYHVQLGSLVRGIYTINTTVGKQAYRARVVVE